MAVASNKVVSYGIVEQDPDFANRVNKAVSYGVIEQDPDFRNRVNKSVAYGVVMSATTSYGNFIPFFM